MRKTTQEFIEDAKKVHQDKYDYSKVDYVDCNTKICIICPEHGEFWQTPHSHLNGRGCPKCSKRGKKYKQTREYFIEKARSIHGDKYDYTKVDYVDCRTKVCIICPEHGEFWQTPHNHNYCNGGGCPKCSLIKYTNKKSNTSEFIEKARAIHGDKYDYSKVDYINNHSKVCIICPEHGEFWQVPSSHLGGSGCNSCSKPVSNTDTFIKRAKDIHGDKYDYTKIEYVNTYTPVNIICKTHGEFTQLPSNHLSGKGCYYCNKSKADEEKIFTKEKFIMKARQVHGWKYDYTKVEYISSRKKVCIICPKHGEFWMTPNKHLMGENCPKCNVSKLEKEVIDLLDSLSLNYIPEFSPKWIGRKRYDFCIEDKIIVECQGEQHYRPVDFGGKLGDKINESFEKIKKSDKIKKSMALKHGYYVVYYTKENLKESNEITDIMELKEKILQLLS